MRPHRVLFLMGSLAILFVVGPEVSADVHLVQTDADTLSLDPLRLRVEFWVIDQDPVQPACTIGFGPIPIAPSPEDSCHVFECETPAGWRCSLREGDGGIIWNAISIGTEDCLQPGEQAGPFSIVTGSLNCCFEVAASSVFEPWTITTFCLESNQVVQVQTETWGRLKAVYR
jgi:hypothetical protein